MEKSFKELSPHKLSADKEPSANKVPSANKEPKELFIDVSEYEQPIPFEKVMQLLFKMKKGEYIRMHHRKKPLPLFQFLQENGFNYIIHQGSNIPWVIIIWHQRDIDVEDYCLAQFSA